MTVREVTWKEGREALLAVRAEVFVVEQRVPVELEDDGSDVGCWQVLAEDGEGRPVGTARLGVNGRVGRVAVLREMRRCGVGRLLMAAVSGIAEREGISELMLHAQLTSVAFYSSLGFEAYGEEFEEAGIAHVSMRR